MNKRKGRPTLNSVSMRLPSFEGKGFIDKRSPDKKMKDLIENKVKTSPEEGDLYFNREQLWAFHNGSWCMIN